MAIQVVGSKMPSDNGYGQNGFDGPSSDTPGKNTQSALASDVTKGTLSLADAYAECDKRQNRNVGPGVKPSFGMTGPAPSQGSR
jgi:hypothetical protein